MMKQENKKWWVLPLIGVIVTLLASCGGLIYLFISFINQGIPMMAYSDSHQARVYDVKTGAVEGDIKINKSIISKIFYCSEQKLLVCDIYQKGYFAYDTISGKQKWNVDYKEYYSTDFLGCSPDKKKLYLLDQRIVRIIDLENGTQENLSQKLNINVDTAAMDSNAQQVALVYNGIWFYSIIDNKAVKAITFEEEYIDNVVFSEDNQKLFLSSFSDEEGDYKKIIFYEYDINSKIRITCSNFDVPKNFFHYKLTPKGQAVIHIDNNLTVVDIHTGKRLLDIKGKSDNGSIDETGVKQFCVSKSGDKLAVITIEKEIEDQETDKYLNNNYHAVVYNTENWNKTIIKKEFSLDDVCFSEDGNKIVVISLQ